MYPAEMMCLITRDLRAIPSSPASAAWKMPRTHPFLRFLSPLGRAYAAAWLSVRGRHSVPATIRLPAGSEEQR